MIVADWGEETRHQPAIHHVSCYPVKHIAYSRTTAATPATTSTNQNFQCYWKLFVPPLQSPTAYTTSLRSDCLHCVHISFTADTYTSATIYVVCLIHTRSYLVTYYYRCYCFYLLLLLPTRLFLLLLFLCTHFHGTASRTRRCRPPQPNPSRPLTLLLLINCVIFKLHTCFKRTSIDVSTSHVLH